MPKTRTSGIGRPKGVPNKLTSDVKAMILGALDQVGGQDYLARQAVENPGPFMSLVGRVLPSQIANGPDALSITFLHLVAAREFSAQLHNAPAIEGKAEAQDTNVSTPSNLATPATE